MFPFRSVAGANLSPADPELGQHPLNFRLEIPEQLIGSRDTLWPRFIIPRAVPVIVLSARPVEPRALRQHPVGIVEADQPIAVRVVQRERIAHSVRTFWRRRNPFDLELQPIALFEMMNASIKGQQNLKCVLIRNGTLTRIMSYHDVTLPR